MEMEKMGKNEFAETGYELLEPLRSKIEKRLKKEGEFMAKIRKDFCPICGKTEISREPAGKINYDAGGWNERCPVCNSLLWVPADLTEPIEAVVVPALGILAFGPEIIFDSEVELLEKIARGEEIKWNFCIVENATRSILSTKWDGLSAPWN